ncbi:MAG: hypothetical protein EP333_08340 [Bacteroidetes bacterium]|nr:MAG: hypothetical protein EP333_08340 [Bacteroidota bacterium]
MRRNLTFPLFIAGLGVIIALGIAAYRIYLAPVYTQNLDHIKIVHFDGHEEKLHFEKYANQKEVYSLELEIEGKTKSNFTLVISNPDGPVHTASIKGGKKVSFTYVNDWYQDEMELKIVPDPKDKGKLEIHCRFIAF